MRTSTVRGLLILAIAGDLAGAAGCGGGGTSHDVGAPVGVVTPGGDAASANEGPGDEGGPAGQGDGGHAAQDDASQSGDDASQRADGQSGDDASQRADGHGGEQDASTADAGPRGDGGSGGADGGTAATGLHVVMGTGAVPGHIVNSAGQVVQLHGADRSGTEYACIQGWGFFDGPSDQASIDAMKTWHINAVRVPLNEDCWLGINGVDSAYGGTNYQNAVRDYVNLLTSNSMVTILDLHWTAPGSEQATGQLPMADADHSPTFWSQVAAAYKSNGAVIFDLFNEPYIGDWTCWASGGATCAQDGNNANYTSAGMAALLKAVRGAGATNVVILGGLAYSSDFSKWVQSVNGIPGLAAPLDGISLLNVAASWHIYDFNDTGCPSVYNSYSAAQKCDSAGTTVTNAAIDTVLAAGFPVVIGETGISAYQSSTPFSAAQVQDLETWFKDVLTWADQQGQAYLAWDWNTSGNPFLVTDYSGTPTPGFGQTYQAHLKTF